MANLIHITYYTPGCLLDYSYFKTNNKMIAIDLSKQQFLDADPKVIQQINFMASLDIAGNTTMFFIRNCVRLFKRSCRSFVSATSLNAIPLNNLNLIKIKLCNTTS